MQILTATAHVSAQTQGQGPGDLGNISLSLSQGDSAQCSVFAAAPAAQGCWYRVGSDGPTYTRYRDHTANHLYLFQQLANHPQNAAWGTGGTNAACCKGERSLLQPQKSKTPHEFPSPSWNGKAALLKTTAQNSAYCGQQHQPREFTLNKSDSSW